MSNMSNCRFRNTLSDLNDCNENLLETDLSEQEFDARKKLIETARYLVEQADKEGITEATFADQVAYNDEDELEDL